MATVEDGRVWVKDPDVNAVLSTIYTELQQKLEAGQEVALSTATLSALENIVVTGAVSVTNWPGDFPLPLSQLTALLPQTDALTDAQLRAAPVPISDGGASLTVDGPLTDAELRNTPVPVDTGLLQPVQAGDTVVVTQGTAGAQAWPVDIQGGTVDVGNLNQLAVTTDIDVTDYNLAAAAYSQPVAYAFDSYLGGLALRFSTTAARTITVSRDDGTVIWTVAGDMSLTIDLDFEDYEVNEGTTVTVAITQTGSPCLVDVTLTSLTGTAALGGSSRIAAVAPDGSTVNIPLGGWDPTNSWIISDPWTGTGPYTHTGTYRRTSGYETAFSFVVSDVQLDVARLRYSDDGVNPSSSAIGTTNLSETFFPANPPTLPFDIWIYLDVTNPLLRPFARMELEVSTLPSVFFEASIIWLDEPYTGSFDSLTANLSNLSTALLTRSVLAGTKPDGTFGNAGLTYDASLKISQEEVGERLRFKTATATRAMNGKTLIADHVKQYSVDFSRSGSLTSMSNVGSANGGGMTLFDSMLRVATGTAVNGKGQATTVDIGAYDPGEEIHHETTIIFATPEVGLEQWVGPFDGDDGFLIGYRDLDFGIRHMRAGVEESFTLMADWAFPPDGSASSLYRRENVPEAYDPTKLNLLAWSWEHLGVIPLLVQGVSPDGEWIGLELHRFPNMRTNTSLANPRLPMTYIVEKMSGAIATDKAIFAGSCWGGRTGSRAGLRLSDHPGRQHVGSQVTAITTDTTMYAVPAGTKFYITGFTMSAINTASTTGQVNLRDGSAGTVKLPLLVPAKQGAGADGQAIMAANFTEPMEFSTEVYVDIIGAGVTTSCSVVGYTEVQ